MIEAIEIIETLKAHFKNTVKPLGDDSRRIFHGRGGCFDGLNHISIDWFAPAVVITLYKEESAKWQNALVENLIEAFPEAQAIYLQCRYLPSPKFTLVWGEEQETLSAVRKGVKFKLNLQQQNIGYFLDIEPARQWLEDRCHQKNVLNLFAFTCSFSVVASSWGASAVLNMDLSSPSLSMGRESYRINKFATDKVKFYANDILKSWGRIKKAGPYDLAVIDPPSFQKGSFVATKDYEKVLRRLDALMVDGGEVLLCLNAPEIPYSEFLAKATSHLPNFEFIERLAPHPDFPDIDKEKSLKLLVFKKVAR